MADVSVVGGGKKEKKKRSSSKRKEDDAKGVFLRSVAAFLEKNGFSRTLAAFLSESQLESDGLEGHSLDLNDIFCKFLDLSKDPAEVRNGCPKEQDVQRSHLEMVICDASDDSIRQKKRKKSNAVDNTPTKLKKHDSDNKEESDTLTNGMQKESGKLLVEDKQKKRKNRQISDSIEGNSGEIPVERSQQESENKNQENQFNESHVKSESKKKKKAKLISGAIGENTEQVTVEEKSLHAEAKTDSPVSQPAMENEAPCKSKDKKKKKHKSTSETKINGQLDEDVSPGVKKENVVCENQDDLTATNPNKENDPVSKDMTNGSKDEVNGRDTCSSSKTKKSEQKRSAEPKSVNAFQRVKIDEVEFVDERLQDNSYWAKGGADSGYGAKAQEILGQVRGRNFRHEKTKKKRGSYRGGQIDLESHSIKFNYSDEDE